jgi:DNA-binding transcriptional regulator YiaG
MPFCHLRLIQSKPKNDSYLWKADHYPAQPRHIGEEIKKRRFDLKITAVQCCKILKIDKSTLVNWEAGRHEPSDENRQKIVEFLMDAGQQK